MNDITGGHCCACTGVCGHTTPPSYCDKHGGKQSNPFTPQPMTGWICPVCNAGLSPFTTICPNSHGGNRFTSPFRYPNPGDFFD